MKPQIWTPTPTTDVRFRGLRAMHGGPRAMYLPEHTHAETQVQVRFQLGPDAVGKEAATSTLYSPHQPHQGGWEQNWEVVVLLLSPELLAQAAYELFTRDCFAIKPFSRLRSPLIEQLCEAVRLEIHSPHGFMPFYMESLGHVMAGHLLRHHADTAPARSIQGLFSIGQLRRIDAMIDERMEHGLEVAELATAVKLGPQRFSKRFRHTTGMSPWSYVQARRVARARQLLADPRLSLSEIALRLGYAGQSHFSNDFRKATGVTPNTYRQQS